MCDSHRCRFAGGPSLRLILIAATFAAAAAAPAQHPYPDDPDWISSDLRYSTGGALADINGDGLLDLIVANGNDMRRERVAVYHNRGNGVFPLTPDWESSDVEYNGHLDVADVNGDGWPDVAVAVLLPGIASAKVYLNNAGTLSSLPDWFSNEADATFGCAFGDMNGDGRPDLALASGWMYGRNPFPVRVYLNVNGVLSRTPAWSSRLAYIHNGCTWEDADRDGWLDLVQVGSFSETVIFRNEGGMLGVDPAWSTSDSPDQDSIMAVAGDVNGDGWADLFTTDNTQLSGSGRFRQYNGLETGYYTRSATWSYFDGYGSAVALADVNLDGRIDLATGAWWDNTRLFYNHGAGLPALPSWSSRRTSVIEKIVFGDVNPHCGVEQRHTERFEAPQGRPRQFTLARRQISTVLEVRLDGSPLPRTAYTFNRERAWISVDLNLPGRVLEVDYAWSPEIDMAITNWDAGLGNFMYLNRLFVDCNGNRQPDGCDVFNGASEDRNGNGIPDECEGPRLAVDAACPGGGAIRVEWSGATPGGQAALIYALNRGSFAVPPQYPCAGTRLGLGASRIRVAWQGGAGVNGGRVLTGTAPRSVCGGFIQLLDIATCGPSNVAVVE